MERYDERVVDQMTNGHIEILKQLMHLKYFSSECQTDLRIAMRLNLSIATFYRYENEAKSLYEFTKSIKN